ncbi:hypothetical protein [Mycobacteroides chelonae]|uniref:hypothetical protein n=1 Tax=Mycobacteroides chelonae TaxID=1774 RepID=UPI001041D899|nr:hypothetical protein [Mycobacteroides chelonae]
MPNPVKAVLVLTALAIALTGCEDNRTDYQTHTDYADFYLKVRDSRTVYCVTIRDGLSCDWGNAK